MLSDVVSDPYSGKKVVTEDFYPSLCCVSILPLYLHRCFFEDSVIEKEKPANTIIKNIGILLRSFSEAIECLLVVIGVVVVVVEDERIPTYILNHINMPTGFDKMQSRQRVQPSAYSIPSRRSPPTDRQLQSTVSFLI